MELLLIAAGAFIATSLMTHFSYLDSRIKGRQLREPELLNILISHSSFFPFQLNRNGRVGWTINYLIGCIFVTCFYFFWKLSGIKPSVSISAILGFLAGIVGI